jgi:DNA repair exonuclease SbcCD nuclease subunit
MKIAVISDMHFGYGYGTELEDDSFDNANEAIDAAMSSGADFILIPGDIFDSRFPKTDVLTHAVKILAKPLVESGRGVNVESCSKELKPISARTLQHIPVIAIHGTHERRHGANTIEALENAGMLVHLHKETICLEKDGVRVAVHAMSGLPERDAKQNLVEWNPKPMENCINILMMHQSIDPFIYSPLEPTMLKIEDLPRGFDLVIDGHLHMHGLEKSTDSQILFPGSTVITQFEENEADGEKGFYLIDVGQKLDIEFVPLRNSRKFFILNLQADSRLKERIENEIERILSNNFSKIPLIKVRITGSPNEVIDQELKEMERKYSDRAILRVVKSLESPEMAGKVELLRMAREEKMTIEEMGMKLLNDSLKGMEFEGSFDHERLFDILADGDVDNAFNILIGEQKTLVNK